MFMFVEPIGKPRCLQLPWPLISRNISDLFATAKYILTKVDQSLVNFNLVQCAIPRKRGFLTAPFDSGLWDFLMH